MPAIWKTFGVLNSPAAGSVAGVELRWAATALAGGRAAWADAAQLKPVRRARDARRRNRLQRISLLSFNATPNPVADLTPPTAMATDPLRRGVAYRSRKRIRKWA